MKTYNITLKILQEVPFTRNSDNDLFWEYARRRGLVPYGGDVLYKQDFMHIRFETLRRCRQQIQKSHPELRGSNYKLRHKKASEYPVFLEEDGQSRMI